MLFSTRSSEGDEAHAWSYVFHQTLVLNGVGIRIVQKISKILNMVLSYVGYNMEGHVCGGIVWVHTSRSICRRDLESSDL